MPPKGSKKKEGESSVPTLPAISPLISAAQTKYDKWVKRVQDITRARADAIRDKSGLILTLKEGEAKVRGLDAEADTVAFQLLRPPPPPPPLSPSTVSAPPPHGGKARKSATSVKGMLLEPPIEQWKPPEANEAKRLQKAGESLLLVYFTKRGGPEKPSPENDKAKRSLRKKQQLGGDALHAGGVISSPTETSEKDAVLAAAPSRSFFPISPQQQSPKGPKGGAKKDAGDREGEPSAQLASSPQQMVSLSLAAGTVAIAADPTPAVEEKGGRTPRTNKKSQHSKNEKSNQKEASQSEDTAHAQAGGGGAVASFLPPIYGGGGATSSTPFPDDRGKDGQAGSSFRGLEELTLSPLADGMEKPKQATFAQWNRILQLRQERLDLMDANAVTRDAALQARDRITQLKEMEAIGRYGLGAAQRELEQITGSSVPPIPGITAPLVVPQPPGTPRNVAAAVCPTTSQLNNAASRPESSRLRASVAVK